MLKAQNWFPARHANSPVYTALAQLVDFTVYFLKLNPCVICDNPKVGNFITVPFGLTHLIQENLILTPSLTPAFPGDEGQPPELISLDETLPGQPGPGGRSRRAASPRDRHQSQLKQGQGRGYGVLPGWLGSRPGVTRPCIAPPWPFWTE